MLTGEPDNKEAIERTKYSILTVNKAEINTDELALRVCNWEESLAKEATRSLLFKYGNNIEAVIANNDAMALGAIKVLQEYGYNKGDERRTIPVVGVDAVEEAREFIAKGYMTGTVIQDDKEMAKAIYLTGMNFVFGRNPLEGTPYKFDQTGAAIRIPYREYIANIVE
jgi:methyl-galactoside transport system substrate-binding protein